jgi:hypothetical protein
VNLCPQETLLLFEVLYLFLELVLLLNGRGLPGLTSHEGPDLFITGNP